MTGQCGMHVQHKRDDRKAGVCILEAGYVSALGLRCLYCPDLNEIP